jgi:hypothetical protein
MTYRWRVVSPLAPLRDQVRRLADATAAAESFLLAGSDTGDVAVVFGDQPGAVPEWVPQVVGVRSGGRVTWHPWPPGWLPGTELAALAKTGGDLESRTWHLQGKQKYSRGAPASRQADGLGFVRLLRVGVLTVSSRGGSGPPLIGGLPGALALEPCGSREIRVRSRSR